MPDNYELCENCGTPVRYELRLFWERISDNPHWPGEIAHSPQRCSELKRGVVSSFTTGRWGLVREVRGA